MRTEFYLCDICGAEITGSCFLLRRSSEPSEFMGTNAYGGSRVDGVICSAHLPPAPAPVARRKMSDLVLRWKGR